MKKIISALLSFTMILSSCLTSFAVETDDIPSKACEMVESSAAANFSSYIKNTLAPKYGYADMSDQSTNIKMSTLTSVKKTFVNRNGIAGYDTADMNGDGITDMIVYRYYTSNGACQLKADFYKASSTGSISYVNSMTLLNFDTDFVNCRFYAGIVKKNGKNCLVTEYSYVPNKAVDYAINFNIYEISSGKLQKSYNLSNGGMVYYDRLILKNTLNSNKIVKEFVKNKDDNNYWVNTANSAFSYLKMPKASNNSLSAINKLGYQNDWSFPKTASYFDTSAEAKTFFILSVYKDHNSNDYNKYYVTVTNTTGQYNNSTKKVEPLKPEQTVITLPKTGKYYGDLDADNKITAADSFLALRASVKLVSLTSKQKTIADVDSSGTVDSSDSLMILRYSVRLKNTGKTGKQAY